MLFFCHRTKEPKGVWFFPVRGRRGHSYFLCRQKVPKSDARGPAVAAPPRSCPLAAPPLTNFYACKTVGLACTGSSYGRTPVEGCQWGVTGGHDLSGAGHCGPPVPIFGSFVRLQKNKHPFLIRRIRPIKKSTCGAFMIYRLFALQLFL